MMGTEAKEVVKFIQVGCSMDNKEWHEKRLRGKEIILKEKKKLIT